ncbi:MAG TPA: NADH-quinone oxidoreductase subunit L [Verrucomicrobiae bacterium]|nr:NADH-quinone oxidoreductase subunit L [Verrucomicrobiae bacterium]
MVEILAWLVLFLPLLSVAVITIFTRGNPARSAIISICAAIGSFVCGFVLFEGLPETSMGMPIQFHWLAISDLHIDIGLRLDHLSLPMTLVVTGVGSLIHIYSLGYMKGDPGFARYFACLSLFTFSMLGIVLADNFVMLFIFWELVGISSYLLIGFWYERPSAADACKKAFLTNRVGDFGFLLGILLVWATLGSLNFRTLENSLEPHKTEFGAVATIAGLLIFCGAMGKSAQFPLHVWLPDAMEGPTPVSALIHAATMVAAGVYMLCRVFFLLHVEDSQAMPVIAWIGGITALMAALIALQQNDIKRILAYSTLSQLGYMVMAVGCGGPAAALYHLTTHAFFKALLFLGAGSVILGLHHEQNIWTMGGLRQKMRVTFWTFAVGTLALCGVPPLSGFYSKDSILAQAIEAHRYGLFVLGVVVAFLTTFYMFRLFYVAFVGRPRTEAVEHAHESPGVMLWPLRLLAVLSLIGGVLGIEQIYARHFDPDVAAQAGGFWDRLLEPFNAQLLGACSGLLAIVFGFFWARSLYRNSAVDPLPEKLGIWSRLLRDKFYIDEIYERVLIPCTQEALAKLADWLDRWIIGTAAVRGTANAADVAGRLLRLLQTGNLQMYAFLLVAGVAGVLYWVLAK